MKEIFLTQGKVAIVDDADYERVNQYKWCAHKKHSGLFYAVRQSPKENGGQTLISMSRFILELELGDKRQADHQNHITLDNRRSNLRICTNQRNNMNRKANKNTTSRFKGVSWSKRDKKWYAFIHIAEKTKYLGGFVIEELAALAYDMVAIREHGEFAQLNF